MVSEFYDFKYFENVLFYFYIFTNFYLRGTNLILPRLKRIDECFCRVYHRVTDPGPLSTLTPEDLDGWKRWDPLKDSLRPERIESSWFRGLGLTLPFLTVNHRRPWSSLKDRGGLRTLSLGCQAGECVRWGPPLNWVEVGVGGGM